MLKSNQIKVFWHLEDVNQIQKIDFSKSTPPAGQHKQKWEIVIFKNLRRPQGNTLNNENREFPKIKFEHRNAEQIFIKNVLEHRTP